MAAQPEDHPAVAVFDYVGRIDNFFRATVGRHLPPGVSFAQFQVLRLLERRGEGQTPAEIARAIDAPKSALTNTLQRLEQGGLSWSEASGEDARKKRVWLTPEGRDLYLATVAATRPKMDSLRGAFTLDEFREALPFLKALTAWFEED